MNYFTSLLPAGRAVARAALMLAILVSGLALAATKSFAQTVAPSCLADMNLYDSSATRYRSTSGALRNTVYGVFSAQVRGGKVTYLNFEAKPETVGSNKLRYFNVTYYASSATLVPTYRCTKTSTGMKVTISKLPAKQYFSGTTVRSDGFATLEITFHNTGPGTMKASYTHSVFSSAGSATSRQLRINGTVLSGAPQGTDRLYIAPR